MTLSLYLSNVCLMQGLTIDLKRVYVSVYMLKKLGVCHIQGKNYKNLKKHMGYKSKKKDENPFWFYIFLKLK